MQIIGQILIWGSLGLIIYWYFKEKKSKAEMERTFSNRYENAKIELYDVIEKTLGKYEADNVKNKKIWVNMPKTLLLYVMGNPHDKKVSVSKDNQTEIWQYNPSEYKYGGKIRYKYSFQVTLVNNRVTGWQNS